MGNIVGYFCLLIKLSPSILKFYSLSLTIYSKLTWLIFFPLTFLAFPSRIFAPSVSILSSRSLSLSLVPTSSSLSPLSISYPLHISPLYSVSFSSSFFSPHFQNFSSHYFIPSPFFSFTFSTSLLAAPFPLSSSSSSSLELEILSLTKHPFSSN